MSKLTKHQPPATYTLELSEREATALRMVLGSLTDIQFRDICGLNSEGRDLVGGVWNELHLRHEEDEDES